MEKKEIIEKYIESLSQKERKALEIAKNHLGTLFTIEKCNGFLQWKKKQETVSLIK
jgi:hypothetical protein